MYLFLNSSNDKKFWIKFPPDKLFVLSRMTGLEILKIEYFWILEHYIFSNGWFSFSWFFMDKTITSFASLQFQEVKF